MALNVEKAYFALACFWKPDAQFGCLKGVLRTRVGYCGGTGPVPNYPKVNDHTEAIEIQYDPSVLSFEELLRFFWEFHDPCICQKRQYMSAIFYTDEIQKNLAEKNKYQRDSELQKHTTTQILPLNVFHEAEDYHQKYFLRIYHRGFYASLKKQNATESTRDARLNGYLSGYGQLEQLISEREMLDLTEEQFEYVKSHLTGDRKSATFLPFLHTISQVSWNFLKKSIGY